MKRKLANGKEIDVRVLSSWCGNPDEYYEYYFPDDAKKDRLEKIDKLKKLINEFETIGDIDSLGYAKDCLKIAEESYNNFIKTVYYK